jgi:hypothetical protein
VALINAAGRLSVTTAPLTADGPLLVTTIVYLIGLPATLSSRPSVFVICRSAVGASVSVSGDELFPVLGSVVPVGAAIVAVLSIEPVAVGAMVATNVYVAIPSTARLAVVLMLPTPEGAAQVEPVDATQVHVALINAAGRLSVMTAPETADGPLFVAVMVYVTDVPGISFVELSVLTMARSAVGVSVSVSVAWLLPAASVVPVGARIVAVLLRVPVAVGTTVAVIVYVAVPLVSKSMVSTMLPVPDVVQVEPAVATQVQFAPVKVAGRLSVNVAPTTADGPAFFATTV